MGPRTVFPLATLAAAALLLWGAATGFADVTAQGNPKRGKVLFSSPSVFCASCHTLKAAKSTGRDGPNLDKKKLSYAAIVAVVTKGRKESRRWPTGMPGYSGPHAALRKSQIQDVAAFVYAATHK